MSQNDKYCIAGNKRVAIKIQKLTPETQSLIVEEYRVLRDFAGHPNLPDFYGIYRRRSAKKSEHDEIWFVMEVRHILSKFTRRFECFYFRLITSDIRIYTRNALREKDGRK